MAFSLFLCIKATCSFARPLFCFSAACCPVVDMWRLRRVGKSRIQHSVLACTPLVARTRQEVGCRHDGSSGFLEKCCSSVDPAAALATFLLPLLNHGFICYREKFAHKMAICLLNWVHCVFRGLAGLSARKCTRVSSKAMLRFFRPHCTSATAESTR